MVSEPPEPPDEEEPSGLLDSLVSQTMDDLEEARFTVESALRAIVRTAWRLGRGGRGDR